MTQDWQELTKITAGADLVVNRVTVRGKGIALEGEFELPPLARLTIEDQLFIAAFVRSHGSIKDMEALYGISYPTVKNHLNRISQQLEWVEIDPPASQNEILDRLGQGDISVEEALKEMEEK